MEQESIFLDEPIGSICIMFPISVCNLLESAFVNTKSISSQNLKTTKTSLVTYSYDIPRTEIHNRLIVST